MEKAKTPEEIKNRNIARNELQREKNIKKLERKIGWTDADEKKYSKMADSIYDLKDKL